MTDAAKPPRTQLIVVENQQTQLHPRDLLNCVTAINSAVTLFYNTSPWVVDGHSPLAHVVQLPKGARPPAGSWNLILLDNSTQAGALGFHDDENGSEIPYSDVFVKTSIEDGSQASAVACHEAFEMLVDPHVVSPWVEPDPENGNQYIVEVGDPVQGNDFDIGEAHSGKANGLISCDFAYPAWWGIKQSGNAKKLSFRDSVSTPFVIASQGYISYLPAGANPADPNAPWSQTFGSERTAELPVWASRLPRIHGR